MPALMMERTALNPFSMAGFSAAPLSNPQRTQLRTGPQIRSKRWILDVDGTLMLRDTSPEGRGPYDWERVIEDRPNEPVVEIVRGLAAIGKKFLVVSGRIDKCRYDTVRSLRTHVFRSCGYAWDSDDLLMRDEGRQHMLDDELKREIYLNDIEPFFEIEGVLDDRSRVVKMWRSLGLPCMQVAEGNF